MAWLTGLLLHDRCVGSHGLVLSRYCLKADHYAWVRGEARGLGGTGWGSLVAFGRVLTRPETSGG